jgi:probable phosphoglycerate mutase
VTVETIIHTLRHAQTTYGAEQRYAGSIDAPLSAKGVADCAKAAPMIDRLRPDIVVTSTMERAVETARLVGHEPSSCIRTSLCNERRYGILEGRTWQDVQALDPPVLFVEVGNERHSVNPSGGEPFEDVWQRAREFRRVVLDQYEGRTILVISHSTFLQMLNGVLRGSNCIEALATPIASLDLTTFRMAGAVLLEESGARLLGAAGEGF